VAPSASRVRKTTSALAKCRPALTMEFVGRLSPSTDARSLPVKLCSQRSRIVAKSLCRSLHTGLSAAGICLAVAGCSRGPTRLDAPDFDPAESAGRAMKQYDQNGDGFVAGDELEKAPGLKAAIKNLDMDDDGKVSEQEIADRVNTWLKMNVGLTKFSCLVTLDGTPLQGATVTFVPEEFLGGAVQQAEDVTTMVGSASPRIPKEKRPSPDSPPGMQLGLYQVQISLKQGDKETIPAKYNTQTVLGQEVSNDDWAIQNNQVRFNLTTK
jgi:hypothetical protein